MRVPRVSPGRDAGPDAVRDFVAACDDGHEREGQAWLRQLTTADLLQVGQDAGSRWRRETRFAWGWCLTTHKAQGSEYPAVVIPVTTQHYPMLQRNLLYTAVTRGRQLVVLVAQARAVAIAVKGKLTRRRWSKLQEWLTATPPGHSRRKRQDGPGRNTT